MLACGSQGLHLWFCESCCESVSGASSDHSWYCSKFCFQYSETPCSCFFFLLQNKSYGQFWKLTFTLQLNLKYIYVIGIEIGFWNLWDGSCVAVKGDRPRTPTDAQVCQHDSTVHVQRFSHLEGRTDNHDIIRWCHCHYAYVEVRGLYKGVCMSPGGSCLGFWLNHIWLHFVRSHRPSPVATSVPLEEWDYNLTGKCPLFIQL